MVKAAYSTQDVSIRVGVAIQEAMAAFNTLERRVEASARRMSRVIGMAMDMDTPGRMADRGWQQQIVGRLRQRGHAVTSVGEALSHSLSKRGGFGGVKKQLQDLSSITQLSGKKLDKMFNQAVVRANKNLGTMSGRLSKTTDAMKAQQPEFAGYAMSIMFFGMAMQRIFLGIWKTSTKTFQDVMHSVEGTVTNTDRLNSSWEYFKFAVGSALDPLMGWLAPIIASIAEWVAQNQRLVATIVGLGTLLGTLFMSGGALKLAWDGFVGLKAVLASTKLGGALAGLSVTSPWILALVAAAGAAALLYKSLKDNPEAMDAVKDGWESFEKDAVTPFKESFMDLVSLLSEGEVSMEDFGWVTAWAAEVGMNRMKSLINVVTLLVEEISMLIAGWQGAFYAYQALQRLKSGDVQGAKASMRMARDAGDRLIEQAQDVADSVKALGGTNLEFVKLVRMGPGGYKEQKQAEQRIQQFFQIRDSFNGMTKTEAETLIDERFGDTINQWRISG